jgi:hypothetical protein
MLHTSTEVVSDSTITPDQEYPADWTGAVSGTFVPVGVTPPAVIPAAVALDAASDVAASSPGYRGIVAGTVTMPAAPNRWIIQVYRAVGAVRAQVPKQALVQPDGTFTIDLAGITDPGPGEWQFGVLDANSGYAPVGEPWPSAGTFVGWEIRSFVTTDRRYFIGSQPASVDGTFDFANSAPGTKTFQLVATPGEQVLAEHSPATGLVRSLQPLQPDDDRSVSYVYDQALALQSALVMGDPDTAATLAEGLRSMQTFGGPQSGGFISVAAQANPAAGEPNYLTGNNAIATYALLSYLRNAPESQQPALRLAVENAVDWLLGQQVGSGAMTGLLTGGWQDNIKMSWASTEHNLDAWQAFSLAAAELDCARCAAAAAALETAIPALLWIPTENRFAQGARPEGLDTVEPLDVNSWGAIFLDAVGRPDLAGHALGRTPAFSVTDQGIGGYRAFKPQPFVPHPLPVVWAEGTLGVALAQSRHGDTSGLGETMTAIAAAQRADGSLPMASSPDPDRELTTASSMAATGWFILASRPDHPDSLWAPPAG